MPFRFYHRFQLSKGLRLNLSRSGLSASVGPQGLHATFGPRSTRLSAGIPGTGLSWYTNVGHVQASPPAVEHVCRMPECNPRMVPVGKALGFLLFGLALLGVVVLLGLLLLA